MCLRYVNYVVLTANKVSIVFGIGMCLYSSLRVKGILAQTVHAAYPIVCFPVLVRTFFT